MYRSYVQLWILFLPVAGLMAYTLLPVVFAPAGYAPATRESDFFIYYFPMAETAFGMLRAGTLPTWNPYLFSGLPFLASIEIGVLYPPNWLHVLLPTARAFCVLHVLHILLAGFGVWMYARGRGRSVASALFSSVVFAFASPALLHHDAGMTSIVYSATWVPLIFALLDRALRLRTLVSICPLALALACQFLAGFPMFTCMLAVLIPAYLLVFGIDWHVDHLAQNRKLVLLFAIAALLALGLVAPQLLTTLEYLGESFRGELVYSESTHCCFPIPNLLTLLIPEFFGNDRNVPYWGETYLFDANMFSGVSTLLLCLIAAFRWREREFLFWSLAFAVILGISLGKYSAFYDFCYLYVPGVDRFRGMARLSIFGVFCLSMLAGMGLDQVLSGERRSGQRRLCLVAGGLAIIALIWGLVQVSFVGPVPQYWRAIVEWVRGPGAELTFSIPPERMHLFLTTSYAAMLRSLCISSGALVAAVVLLELPGVWPRSKNSVTVLWLSLLAAELTTFQTRYVVLTDTEPRRSIAQRVRAAIPDDGLWRLQDCSTDPPFLPNRFLYGRMQVAGGHENFVLYRYAWFLQRWVGLDPRWLTNLTVPNSNHLFDLLNIKYFVAPPSRAFLEPNDVLLQSNVFEYGDMQFSLYCNRDVLSRAFLIHEANYAQDFDSALAILRRLHDGTIERDCVIEAPRPDDDRPNANLDQSPDHVQILEYHPDRIVVSAQSARAGWLLLSDNYYPGWQAYVDGQPAAVYPANLFMRAVRVAAGDHRVELVYRPYPFRMGCRLAAVSFTLILACHWRLLFGRLHWKRPRPGLARPGA